MGRGCCDCDHELEIRYKKGLDLDGNKPKLTVPPRPGPGSSGHRLREVLPLLKPVARFLLSKTFLFLRRLCAIASGTPSLARFLHLRQGWENTTPIKRSLSSASDVIAKPELVYPESTTPKSTRPSGSGDLARNSPGHRDSSFALVLRLGNEACQIVLQLMQRIHVQVDHVARGGSSQTARCRAGVGSRSMCDRSYSVAKNGVARSK